jgi:hypothetical protein
MGIREAAFNRPDSGVLGAHLRDTITVELVATPRSEV